MAKYSWKLADNNPSSPDFVTHEMRVHGDVYQLHKKGLIVDRALPFYASYSRSRYEVKMQFGNNPTVCNIRDETLSKLRKFKKVDMLFDRHKINLATFTQALPEHGHHNEHKNSFWLCLKKFVGVYFRA
jgi:hypothetical protein